MASRDRFTLEPQLDPITITPRDTSQGELFARLALRALPLMKEGPEDALIFAERTIH